MKVLLVKLSSMGDIIHTLPAITDAARAVPGIKFTWLVEEGFQEIANWHPAVEMVIPTSLRKRKLRNVIDCIKKVRQHDYDLVIDAQALIKSAVLSKLANARSSAGYDWDSCREGVASLLYKHNYKITKNMHAIDRIRQLFALALNYPIPKTAADYGINWDEIIAEPIVATDKPYLVFLHGTTWGTKHWPESYWLELADIVAQQGFGVKVTWATAEQKARAQRLAQHSTAVTMLPHLTLNQAASVLNQANGVVAVDTGFAHLSAALNKPIVAIYGASDVKKAGTAGNRSINLAANFVCSPCNKRICTYKNPSAMQPPCLQQISPQLVWDNLSRLIEPRFKQGFLL